MLRTRFARVASALIGSLVIVVSAATALPASGKTIAPNEVDIALLGGAAELAAQLTWTSATSYKLEYVYLCDLKSDGKAPEFQAHDTSDVWPNPPYKDSNGKGSCRYWDVIKHSSGNVDEPIVSVRFHLRSCGSDGCTSGEWSVYHYNPYYV